jgi:hypothetical protein
MRRFCLLGSAALAAMTPAQAAAPVSMSPSVQQDVRCFMLFAAAVDQAGKAKNDDEREATSLAVMYFLGKLTVEAPTLNLVEAVRQEATALEGNPRAKDVGMACDTEFSKRGRELIDFGQKLQQAEPQSSSSS